MLEELAHDHSTKQKQGISEADILRAYGALDFLGMKLGPYLLEGYDCLNSHFQFRNLPIYTCPVEIKKRSKGFEYQIMEYADLPRVCCSLHEP